MGYFDNYELPHGETKDVVRPPKERRFSLVPHDAEGEREWSERQAAKFLATEEEFEQRRQNELDAALKVLRWLIAEGERGFYPEKVLAAAQAARVTLICMSGDK